MLEIFLAILVIVLFIVMTGGLGAVFGYLTGSYIVAAMWPVISSSLLAILADRIKA